MTKEQIGYILNNQALVYYEAKRYLRMYNDYSELVSIGMYGLVKAAINFDPSRNINFFYCAKKYIETELLSNIVRMTKKENKNISIEKAIYVNKGTESEILLQDILKSNINVEEIIALRDECERVINFILNNFTTIEKVIMLYAATGLCQQEIAGKINASQSFVSRKESKVRKALKSNLKLNIASQKYFFTIGDDYYILKYFFEKENENILKLLRYANIKLNKNNISIKIPISKNNPFYIMVELIYIIEGKSNKK